MEEVVNNNIDLFVNLEYNEDGELVISILITDNNQVVNVGEFKKDTKSNIERFAKLYQGLKKPFVIMQNVEKTMENLFLEYRKHSLGEHLKIFHDFYHKRPLFIDIGDNFFLSNNVKETKNKELFLFKVFLNYLFFEYNIKNQENNHLFDLGLDSEEDGKTPTEYEQKITNLRYKVIEDFKAKPYYEELLEILEDTI